MRYPLLISAILFYFSGIPAWSSSAPPEPEEYKPVLELGVGLFTAWFPQYPAARENQTLTLPAPLVRLRTPIVKADREDGLRSLLMDGKNYTLTFSASGSFPAGSKDNPDREGMPTLDLLMEFGPKLVYHAYRLRDEGKLDIHIPLRTVTSASFDHIEEQGFTFSPYISWRDLNLLNTGHEFYFNFGATWATRKLHSYFYEVRPEFVTADRSQHSAKDGFVGSYITMSYVIPLGMHNFYSFVGADFHSGAANEDSPLFVNSTNYSVGVGMSWNLWKSKKLVKVNPSF
ncbi:MAG: hypothetical protein CL677_08020 [Bdellovibrionaceae bacterium]|nr:hypothetical protein [Pseudobdellovibrionaceae bacterium]|tara:strand:+ start:124406 stop:125266 length:861 start_codon:yes stop_codon:yes gene_type:complete